MRRAVIVDILRTPFGKGREGGALSHLHPVDLYARTLQALLARTGIDPDLVEDVITGCVIQVGEQAANIGRQAVLAAGLPETVPSVTLDRKCGSAQQAMDFAAQGVIAGAYDVVIAGGVEMMSRVSMKSNRMGKDNMGPMFHARYPDGLVHQGISAELIAAKWGLDRDAMDRFALRSHQLADAARDRIGADVIDIDGVTADEGLRPSSTLDALGGLRIAFQDDALHDRFPQINWSVTAGNSSQVTDGAGAALIMEESLALKLGLTPRAAFAGFATVGDDPVMMLTGPIPATAKLLARKGLTIDDIAAFEVNEAFASVVLAWQAETGADPDRVNRYGGAIALGHPVGASGMRLMANLVAALEDGAGRYGLQTMCESGGMANATLIERV
ncbi:thiolase family protein [Pseudooceanicola atlanticus]|uniref:Acetyl-CoA acetyltransferase n=1 Tax=Pseudooceanicola atlanticus TaxID=1461694 RepID=A0A0A0EIG0_9RHOB|nr:thiolase family protein [Pseudooceanicola atlanticus]KGM48952.1 acetyl-CoA acetyltransferase [Pseudooceanicola atlanticus]